MSVAKKEEVRSHRIGPRLVQTAGGVPIKKRPVMPSDKSVPSGMPPSMKPSSPATGIAISAAEAGCSKDFFLSRSKPVDANVIAKGSGVSNPQVQNRPKMSFLQCLTEKRRVPIDSSSEIPSRRESDRVSVDESQSHKLLTLDLQLTSRQNGKSNNNSLVKEETVGFPGFRSAEPPKNVASTGGIKYFLNSSIGELSNLDLNVPLDPVDAVESLPTMHEHDNQHYHGAVQHQEAHVPPVAPVSTVSSGQSRNIDSTLNLSNAYGLSNKRGRADLTLDLQLKPPTRPEIGSNWKGLAPVPELSLSLSGKHMDEPVSSAPNAVAQCEPVGSAKRIREEAATSRSDESPVQKAVKILPCHANPRKAMSPTVSGIEKKASGNLVKKEPEEQSQQHIQNAVQKAHLLEPQSVGLVSDCSGFGKTDNTQQVPRKSGLGLHSEIFPNNSTHNTPQVATADHPVPTERLRDVIPPETNPAHPGVKKSIKRESTNAILSPVTATISGQSSPLIATKSLPLEGSITSPAMASCISASQPSMPHSEPPSCNTDEASVDCKPIIRHVHARDAGEACPAFQGSSNITAEPLVFHSRNDGMSQGSAEMDCSEDDFNTVSQLPIPNRPLPHGETPGNSQISENGIFANNLGTDLPKENVSANQQDSSSLTTKVDIQGVDIKDGISTHSGEDRHKSCDVLKLESRNKQLLKSDMNSPMNNSDSTMGVKTTAGSSPVDIRRSSSLGTSASPKMESTMQSLKTSGSCLGKGNSPKIILKGCQPPLSKQVANSSEGHVKNVTIKSEHLTESKEIAKVSELHTRDSIPGEDSHLDGASSSLPENECKMVKSASEKSDCEKSKPDSCKTSSIQNERDGQVDGPQLREMGNAYVNRNERWERFLQSELEKNKGEHQGGRQWRNDHRFGGRGAESRGHPRNFRGPRMDESELYFDEPMNGRRRTFDDDLGNLNRIPHRRRRSPPMGNQMPGTLMRDMDRRDMPDPRLLAHGQIDDLLDDMMEERFYVPHSHRQHPHGDHGFIRRDRSHSPVQRRGAPPMLLHRGRSPEAMGRSPPLIRTDRPYLPHRHHTRRHGSPFERPGLDDRGMPRNTRRSNGAMHGGVEGDTFEPHLHPAELAELEAERRKFGERRLYHQSLGEGAVCDDQGMLSYHAEGDMDFADGGGGPRELDGHLRNRMAHRATRGEEEDGYRCHGPQGWRDDNSNGSRPKRKRY